MQKIVCLVVVFLLVGCFVSPASTAAIGAYSSYYDITATTINDIRYSSYHNMTTEEIQRVVDEAAATDIGLFDSLLENYPDTVLFVCGSIPEKSKGIAAYENWIQMDNISRALADDEIFQSFLYSNGGIIIGQGPQSVCYISIMVLDERADEFTEETMNAVKARVDYYASLKGLADVPIVFFKGNPADSYLTEEQFLYLYDSGYLTINDGFENLTALRSEVGSASVSSDVYAFDNEGLAGTYSLTDRIQSMFQSIFGGSDSVDLSSRTTFEGLDTEKVRPVVGGLMVATTTSSGTIGYAAKDANNSDLRGIVTVAHVFHFENVTSYQPRQSYGNSSIGTFSKINQSGDSVFIPMNASDVKAAVYTGEGDDQLLDVIGYEGAVSTGMPLSKSGVTSGNTDGTYFGVRYNQTFTIKNGTINYTVNSVGVIKESSADSYSMPGDSGGPIYIKTKATVNGTEQDVAVLLGILEGGDGNGTVYYVPCTEIKNNMGIVPLTINDR